MEKEKTKTRIFLSYAKEDTAKVREVYEGLKKRKLDVWFDEEDLKSGLWKPNILKVIPKSRYFFICLSKSALKKVGDDSPGFQDEELNRAWEIAQAQADENFTIVPVRLEDCDRGDNRLSVYQQYDLFDDFEKGLDKLADHHGGLALTDSKANDKGTDTKKHLYNIMDKAYISYQIKEYDKVIIYCDLINDIDPGYVHAYNNRGLVLYHKKEYDKAIANYNKAIELDPEYVIAYNNRGRVFYYKKEYDKAIADYNKAIELDPEYVNAYNNRGLAFYYKKDYDKAIADYNRAIELDSEYALAYYNIGCVYSLQNKKEKALSFLEQSLQKGYENFEWIENDTDWDNVRDSEEFKAIIQKYKNK